MHPDDCPAFEYDNHPERPQLARRIQPILFEIRQGMLVTRDLVADTRPSHALMFERMTPALCPYFAGHYRGERYRCLRFYEAGVHGDARVGAPAFEVGPRMSLLYGRLSSGLDQLDALHQRPDSDVPPTRKLLTAVEFVADTFVTFLGIHPYANGNGHAARLITVAILGRYGYWPSGFTVEPRPVDPPYTRFIKEFRSGNRAPLLSWLLHFIAGRAVTATA